MKARLIELKTLEAVPGEDVALDYRGMLMAQLNRIDPKAGLTYEEIERRLDMRRSLRQAGDTWIVEPSVWEELKTLLKSERWTLVSDNLIFFIKDINQAPETEVGAELTSHGR